MTGIIRRENQAERFERFESLKAGQFWKATVPMPHEGIELDDSLLIESVRWADGKMHTIILRAHPRHYGKSLRLPSKEGKTERFQTMSSHSFLYSDFCNAFIFDPDAKESREDDLKKIQAFVTQKQQELMTTSADPSKLQRLAMDQLQERRREASTSAGGLPALIDDHSMRLASASLNTAVSNGVTESQVEAMQEAARTMSEVAKIQSEWINHRTQEISSALSSMGPYFNEHAAAALASTQDVIEHVENLMQGIKSLDLYTGKDVFVKNIMKGKSAHVSEPLTFTQSILFIDEELSVHLDVNEWFDFQKIGAFFEALTTNKKIVAQLFPTPRCVVPVATTRRVIDYGNPWEDARRNQENASVFLLVRDGENIYQVVSPVESHLKSSRLFPSLDEIESPFRGVDGEKISYNDIRYTDRLASSEKNALHYKRMLILCAGLDHRECLFGEFYDRSMASKFITLDFQEKYFRFIHDDDGTGLLSNPEKKQRRSLESYINWCNSHLRSGSRVMVHWSPLLNPETAPGAVKETPDDKYSSYYIDVHPKQEKETVIARTSGVDTIVDMVVNRYSPSINSLKESKIRVALNKYHRSWNDETSSLPFLVLDAVDPDELEWYIQNRGIRKNHLIYVRFFKETVKSLRAERLTEEPVRLKLLQALEDGQIGMASTRKSVIDKAVVAWRAANRGASLSEALMSEKAWKGLLNQMYLITGYAAAQIPALEQYYKLTGYAPLRLIVTSSGKLGIYLAPLDDERDDRAEPHKWVHLAIVEHSKRGVKETSRSWSLLDKHNLGETTIHEWPESDEWAGLQSVFGTFNEKQRVLSHIDENLAKISIFSDELSLIKLIESWEKAYMEINLKQSSNVQHPSLLIPIGICIQSNSYQYINLVSHLPHRLIHDNISNEEAKKYIIEKFKSFYMHKESAKDFFFRNKNQQNLSIMLSSSKPDLDVFSTNTKIAFDGLGSLNSYKVLDKITSLDTLWKAYVSVAENASRSIYNDKKTLWLHGDLRTELTNEPCLDKALTVFNLRSEPVDLLHISLAKGNAEDEYSIHIESGEAMGVRQWYDIVPVGFDENKSLTGINSKGHIITRSTYCSESEALLGIMKSGKNVTSEEDYSYHLQIKAGPDIKRWIVR